MYRIKLLMLTETCKFKQFWMHMLKSHDMLTVAVKGRIASSAVVVAAMVVVVVVVVVVGEGAGRRGMGGKGEETKEREEEESNYTGMSEL